MTLYNEISLISDESINRRKVEVIKEKCITIVKNRAYSGYTKAGIEHNIEFDEGLTRREFNEVVAYFSDQGFGVSRVMGVFTISW